LQHIAHANYLSSNFSWEVLRFHLIKLNMRCATTQQKEYLPVRAYFLMLSCLIDFALAIDTASG